MISQTDIKKIATLARLSLSAEETEKMTRELGAILGFVEKLGEMNLEGMEATSHAIQVTNVFREDKMRKSNVNEAALGQAPASEGNMFRVPRVI